MGVTTGEGGKNERHSSSSPCPVLWPSGEWHPVSVCFKRQHELRRGGEHGGSSLHARGRGGPRAGGRRAPVGSN